MKNKIIKMKLLELIKKQFQGTAWQKGQVYSLEAKRLDSIYYDLRQCEEFKDRVLQIVNTPTFELKSGNIKKTFEVKSLNITDRTPLILNKPGTVYLYKIETGDFINYKVRLEIVEEIYDLDGLDEEQTDIIQRLIDSTDTWQTPDYIRNRIDGYRQENEGKKIFEEMTKNDMTDEKVNMMDFVKEQFSTISKNGNAYSEGYVEYLNTPGAVLMPRDLYEFNKELIEEWMKSGYGFGFNDWVAEKRKKSMSAFNVNQLADNLKQIEETYLDFEDKIQKSRIDQVNRSLEEGEPISPEAIKKGAENIANKKLTADNFDEVMSARTNTNAINGYQLVETMKEISDSYARGEKPDRDEYIDFDNGKAYLNFNGKRTFFADIEDNRKTYTDIAKDFDNIERDIMGCAGLEEEQILILKEKLKTFEAKLKEKEIKPKTITISGSVHNKIKNHCGYIGIKIGDWVEKVLLEAMQPAIITEKLDYEQQEKQLEKEKEDMVQSWIKSKDRNKVIIADKLILLPKFKFLGYEEYNGKPTYDFIGTEKEFKEAREKIKCNITLAADNKRSLISTYDYKEDNLGEIDETAVFIGRYK